MDDVKQQVIEKLQNANNILVTVSANPTVDQLAACIGLTLLLNKMDKHATAVFSGKVPSTIEFLKPEDTIETTTDSLRDFIISLDKAKADKLRYKVEDEVVKIFITPYKASISEKDLVFSQGDFNVDVVVALGVHEAVDLDNAITAHGRILHDAAVISMNTTASGGQLGAINWLDAAASGLAELVTSLATNLGPNLLDEQISTALLTGIVAQTEHFSNQRTLPATMTASATLLAAGANQQLVSKELAPKAIAKTEADKPADPAPIQPKETSDGELDVPHSASEKPTKKPAKPAAAKPQPTPLPAPTKAPANVPPLKTDGASADPDEKLAGRIKRIEPLPHEVPEETPVSKALELEAAEAPEAPETPVADEAPKTQDAPATMIMPEPVTATEAVAPAEPKVLDDESDDSLDALLGKTDSGPPQQAPAVLPQPNPLTSSAPIIEVPPAPEIAEPLKPAAPTAEPAPRAEDTPPLIPMPAPAPQAAEPATEDEPTAAPTTGEDAGGTLSSLEESVHSSHTDEAAPVLDSDVDSARKAVEDALKSQTNQPVEPLAAVGAVNVDIDLSHDTPPASPVPQTQPGPGVQPAAPVDTVPNYLQMPSMAPAPAGNAAASNMPPFEDLPSTPAPAGISIAPPPEVIAPTNSPLPPQGPPPPPVPPPMP